MSSPCVVSKPENSVAAVKAKRLNLRRERIPRSDSPKSSWSAAEIPLSGTTGYFNTARMKALIDAPVQS
jgi:hypothetical protein